MGPRSSDSVLNVQHTYNKSAGFADMSGEWYEIKMATLLFLRGLNYTEDFFLATNFDGADLKERMQNWWKDGSSNYYLTKSASLWLDLIKSRIMELSLPEWQMLKNLDIQYCQDQVHILTVDITENRVVNIFASGRSTKLTCLKVYQAMAAIQGDKYLFLSLDTCLARQEKLIIGEALTDIVEYYVPRTLQRQHFLKKSVLKDSDSVSVFAISGTTKDRHFTGIPLQTLLLAEVFENDLRVYQESKQFNFHEECDLFLLYDRFVEKKWDVYLSEKKKEDTSNIGVQRDNEDLKNIFMSNHMIAALLRILSPKDLSVLKYKDLQVKGSRFIGRVEQGYDHTGIILGITDGVPRFVHHTFAEYFTAKWFAMNFSENRNFVEHNFWESSYEVVKSIFDRILANDSDLHIAVLRNDVATVTGLLEKGAEVNFRDMGGRSALHLAAVQKNGEDVIKILLKHGADIHLVDEVLQWTGLRYADKVRAWSVIGVILQNKGNTNDLVFTKQTFCDGDYIISALHIAAKGGYIELLEFLLYTDKYINISLDNDKYSLLHVAAQYGQRGVLELLLDKGANILCKDKNENTPMHFASKNGHLDVVQCLVERMESKKFDKEYYRYINLVLEGINSKDKQGKTPLFIASEHNHLEVVKYLTEKGADVEICSRDGYSPLYIALLKGNTNVIHFLKDVATVDKGSKNGWTLMHTASTNGHLNVIEHLLKINANINACNKYGQTPLHIAAKKNNVKVLQFLIQEGALVNFHDKTFGWTPLNYAIQEGYLDIVEHLLNAGAELDVCEKNNMAQSESDDQVGMVHHLTDMETGLIIPNKMNSWAPLFLASWYGHLDIVKVLTVKGAQLDVCEKTSGRSALHIAAEKNHISVAEHLIEKGADINIRGQLGGLTPLHVASQRGNVEMNNAELEVHDAMRGQIALHIAAENSHLHVIKQLVEGGTSVQVRDSNGMTALDIALAQNDKLMMQDMPKESYLKQCERSRNVEMLDAHFVRLEGTGHITNYGDQSSCRHETCRGSPTLTVMRAGKVIDNKVVDSKLLDTKKRPGSSDRHELDHVIDNQPVDKMKTIIWKAGWVKWPTRLGPSARQAHIRGCSRFPTGGVSLPATFKWGSRFPTRGVSSPATFKWGSMFPTGGVSSRLRRLNEDSDSPLEASPRLRRLNGDPGSPLEASPLLQPLSGGDLKAETIRSVLIPEVNQRQEDNIKDNVKNQQVSILCDETTDRKGHFGDIVVEHKEVTVRSRVIVLATLSRSEMKGDGGKREG
uniref:Uncharacterized protein n=1 Tax=Timema poppense TaxID=170557 RepID=A0A7R9D4R6_TIMPO|nr:unnamed protein product [Timema poppensis]